MFALAALIWLTNASKIVLEERSKIEKLIKRKKEPKLIIFSYIYKQAHSENSQEQKFVVRQSSQGIDNQESIEKIKSI